MGNHLCSSKPCRTTAAVKVIRWSDGGLQKFGEAIKVGEVMENPHQFVCDFSDLRAGRRIAALRVEEDLALGRVYVLLPMQKYSRCVLSSCDMDSLNLLTSQCNSAHRKQSSCNSRVFAAVGTGNLSECSSNNGSAEKRKQLQTKLRDRFVVPKLELNEDDDQSMELGLGLRQQRVRGFRYWKPVLDTIKESPRVRIPSQH